MKRIFLDNASTTPLDPEVIETMVNAMQNHYGNPSSIHAEGRQARTLIEQARRTVAKLLNASIGEIFFTSGGSESNNTALKCSVRDLGVRRIISSPTEHHSIIHTLESTDINADEVAVVFLNLDKNGAIDYGQLEDLLKDQSVKTLVSLMHSNNEIGTLLDIEKVADLCQEHNTYFHSDTVQTMGYIPIDVEKMPISFLSGSAHKFYGPKGTGFIYINGDNIVKPLIDGGGQERNMRGGTENTYGIVGLAKALELVHTNREERATYIKGLRQYLKSELVATFPDIDFNGATDNSHYKVLSLYFPASDKSNLLLLNLDIAGISVSGGSACASGVDTGSHVVRAIRGEDDDGVNIRVSFSHKNTKEELDRLLEVLKSVLL